MHAARRVIRREPAGIVFCRPSPAGRVVVVELLALFQQSLVELAPAGTTEPGRVDERRKEGMHSHGTDYMKQTPCGTWRSPLGACDLASSSISLNYVQVANGTPYWVESRPADGGRNVLVTNAGGSIGDLTPAGFSTRTRVHEYGGKPYAIGDG